MAERTLKARLIAEDRASRKIRGVSNALRGLGTIAAAVGVYSLGRQLVRGIQGAIQASAEYEVRARSLGLALQNQGMGARAVREELLEYARELQKVSIATETQIIKSLALSVSMGASAETAQEAAEAATNLVGAIGVDLDTAIRQVNRTLGGYAGELGEVIPELKDFTQEQLRAGEGVRFLNEKFRGFGREIATTFSGAMNNLQTAFNQLQVELGNVITKSPAVRELLEGLTEIIEELTAAVSGAQGQTAVKGFVLALIDLAEVTRIVGTTAINAAVFYRGFIGTLVDGIPNNVIEGMQATAEEMQRIKNESDAAGERLAALRERIEAASDTPLDPVGSGGGFEGATEGAEGFTEQVTVAEGRILTMGEAINAIAQDGIPVLKTQMQAFGHEIEGVGDSMRRTFRNQGVGAINSISNALVNAAMTGKFAFEDFFRSLMANLAAAIARALLLRAILGIAGGGGGGGPTASVGSGLSGGSWAMITRPDMSPPPDLAPTPALGGVSDGGITVNLSANGAMFLDESMPSKVARTIENGLRRARARGVI